MILELVSFRAKIRVIPNVLYERALICTIKYICYEYKQQQEAEAA